MDPDDLPEHIVDLATERVRAHVRRYPYAADTIEGIATWWLGDLAEAVPLEALTQALERLKDEGVLGTRTLPCGKLLWHALPI